MRNLWIEGCGEIFHFSEDEHGVVNVSVDGKPLAQADHMIAVRALFEEVLAIGEDLDETEKAFRREEERAGNAVRNWIAECDMRKRENEELLRKLMLVDQRAKACEEQLARERAKRLTGVQTSCSNCSSVYVAPIAARAVVEGDVTPGVILVCCDCQAFTPWRQLTKEELENSEETNT